MGPIRDFGPAHRTDSLSTLFGLDRSCGHTVALVGAGGKTTTMFALAAELAGRGERVAVTTTTHIARPDKAQCKTTVTDGDREQIVRALERERMVTVAAEQEDGKLRAPPDELLQFLGEQADRLLAEADGSRRLPLKMPGGWEPVLPPGAGRIVAVAGLSCLGRPFGEACHRPELACAALGRGPNDRIRPPDVARLLLAAYGRWGGRVVYLLNQADDEARRELARQAAAVLLTKGAGRVAVTSFTARYAAWYGSEQWSGNE